MIDYTRRGMRCRAVLFMRTTCGSLRRGAEGIVCYEIDSVGKWQIVVEWDDGFIVPVFPEEIELVVEEKLYVG